MFRKFLIAALLVLAASKASFADSLSRAANLSGSIMVAAQLPFANASEAVAAQVAVPSVSNTAHDLASPAEPTSSVVLSTLRTAPESSSLLLLGATFVGMACLMRRSTLAVAAA